MKSTIALALAVLFAAGAADAALLCTNYRGDSIEWFPGKPRPVIDLTLGKDFVCYVGGSLTIDYINARFPGLLAGGGNTILVGDAARNLVLNVVPAVRADYDAIVAD
jgi:hypothetical protein